MRYQFQENTRFIRVRVEASFTLIDYMLLFASALATVFFALFAVLFFGTICVKLFTQNEYEFDKDRYEMVRYLRVFNYLKFRRQELSFSDISQIHLSDDQSGEALGTTGLFNKTWYSLELVTPTKVYEIVKVEEDELDDLFELYTDMAYALDMYLGFRSDLK